MSRRRRNRQPHTLQDFVRAGVLRPVQPTTASGWTRYGTGREFLPAATNYFVNPRLADSNSDGLADSVSHLGANSTLTTTIADSGLGYNVQKVTLVGLASAAATQTIILASSAVDTFTTSDIGSGSVYARLVSATGCTLAFAVGSRTAADAAITGTVVSLSVDSDFTRYEVSRSFAADTNTNRARIYIQTQNFSEGDSFEVWFYRPQLEKTSVTEYLDGAMDDCSWASTADASASTRPASVLTIPVTGGATALTIAARFSANWAANDDTAHSLMSLYAGSDARATVYKHSDNKFYASVTDGTDSQTSASAASTLAAGTVNCFVACSTWADTVDLDLNGTGATQGDASAVGAQTITSLSFASAARSYIGPVVVSPTRKADGWVTAIQADSGAAYTAITRLVRDLMSVGDYIIPNTGDATAYIKIRGVGLPFDMGLYAGTDFTVASYTAGQAIVAIRCDDGYACDYTTTYPLLTARSLVGGFAVIAGRIGASGYMSTAQLLAMQTGGMEVMCHTYTHASSDPTSFADFTYETVTAAEGMRDLGINVASFVRSGYWVDAYAMSTTAFWGTPEDQLLRANFSAYDSYIGDGYHDLPVFGNGRYGPDHYSADEESVATITGIVDTVIAAGQGIELTFHPNSFGGDGRLTWADFEDVLDYIETKVGTGDVACLTPTQLLYARPE